MAEYRMLVVNHAVETGGAERVLIRLLESLDRGLFEPALACPREGPLTVEAEKLGIEAHLGYPSPRLLEVKRRSVGNSGAGVLLYPYDLARTVRGLAAPCTPAAVGPGTSPQMAKQKGRPKWTAVLRQTALSGNHLSRKPPNCDQRNRTLTGCRQPTPSTRWTDQHLASVP